MTVTLPERGMVVVNVFSRQFIFFICFSVMATVPKRGMAVFDVAEVHFLHLM